MFGSGDLFILIDIVNCYIVVLLMTFDYLMLSVYLVSHLELLYNFLFLFNYLLFLYELREEELFICCRR